MTRKIPVTYLFDPLCGWCYGATPALRTLAEHPEIALALAPTGLFSGEGARPMDDAFADYAWSNDRRIARLSGQTFSEVYRDRVLGDRRRRFDSGPATLALTAVRLAAPEAERTALKAIQEARYVEGRDVTDPAVLAEVLEGLGEPEAALRVLAADAELLAANRRRIADARAEMRRFNLTGVPTLLHGEGARRRPIETGALFGDRAELLEHLLVC